ncbi:hypothetical protein VTL71DRAFT_6533 [Oculimacula yallundae]|uniref:Uncharacterized protein n=1 Tax=Oculimacula yallundae TaxID=86028 RepID=A0ABR4BY60_9HELO
MAFLAARMAKSVRARTSRTPSRYESTTDDCQPRIFFVVNGKQATLVSDHTQSGSTTTPTSTGVSPGSSVSRTAPPAASSSKSATTKSSRAPNMSLMVIFWLVAFALLLGVTAAQLFPDKINNTVCDTETVHLEPRAGVARELFQITPLAQSLVRSAADVLLADAKSSRKAFNPDALGQTLFDNLRNESLLPSTNIQIDIIEGKPEDAAKDAIKAIAELLLDLVFEGVAPETAGASIREPCYGGKGEGACDSSSYVSNPWFYSINEFATEEWREYLSRMIFRSNTRHLLAVMMRILISVALLAVALSSEDLYSS